MKAITKTTLIVIPFAGLAYALGYFMGLCGYIISGVLGCLIGMWSADFKDDVIKK